MVDHVKNLDGLCEKAGIQRYYVDVWGKRHDVPEETLETLLEAIGLDDASSPLPAIHVVKAGRQQEVLHKGAPICLPALPIGYHHLTHEGEELFVISAPQKCWLPEQMRNGKRIWGISTQLYGVRSRRNWGIGDFSDLAGLARTSAASGADVIGINPVHAPFVSDMTQYSPYSPSNREFLNFLYLDVTRIEGFSTLADLPIAEGLRASEWVEYAEVAQAKKPVLEALFAHFQKHSDKTGFQRFQEERGISLWQQAVYDALCEASLDQPQILQEHADVHSPAVQDFAQRHAERVEFYLWLQWQADQQLQQAQQAALDAGMCVGLYRDLAVGSAGRSAESWVNPDHFVRGVSVGAPPDEYNRKGQNWGLPPFNPVTLRRKYMAPFISLIRANMRHARALRIDHAFGLSRLFWIPEGHPAAKGAYVTYPLEAMLAVLRVESHLNQCIVIGEDMGTFPPGYKEAAAHSGLLSYRLLYFEREADGRFIQPEDYPALALASISSHDLPTFAGWKSGWDIDLKQQLDLYPKPGMGKTDRQQRRKDAECLAEALRAQNLPDDGADSAQRYLARSPAAIVMVQMEDLMGLEEQANMPGTVYEHPNWRRKLPVDWEEFFSHPLPLAAQLNEERQRPCPSHPLATYRLQFNPEFTFADAATILPYLARLGITHVYASPYFQARAGSMHGYDVIDHTRFSEELGGKQGYRAYIEALRENGLRQIVDFVPNHMGVSEANSWWQDILRHGEGSVFADHFDINWQKRLLLPVLGKPLTEALEDGELSVEGEYVTYFEHRYPLRPDLPPQPEEPLADVLNRQHYRLGYWKEAATDINYRRFFDINELAGVAIEREHVHEAVHALVFSQFERGELGGLRIDHIDGLADPEHYCRRLQERLGPNFYIVVEKILTGNEALPESWPIAGTSGYEVMSDINNVFVQERHAEAFTQLYQELTGKSGDFHEEVYAAKRKILQESFGAEVEQLTALAHSSHNSMEKDLLRQALVDILTYFPVYRSYIVTAPSEADEHYIRQAISIASSHGGDNPAYELIVGLLIGERASAEFTRRFQQLSGPAMAKGCEDTAFYRYHRLISLNEVGSEPGQFGLSPHAFHARVTTRKTLWPMNMNATATHDTKRGEDMRARLNILSQVPQEWQAKLQEWHAMHPSPLEANDTCFLYQTLIGSWPLELLDGHGKQAVESYRERLHAYLPKALREGKERSHWLRPDEGYERKAKEFVDGLLQSHAFHASLKPWLKGIAHAGLVNSLSQQVLKLTLPGIPDIYQGTEYWDFSLVDPDNRRKVDYTARNRALLSPYPFEKMRENLKDGRIKQHLLQVLLHHRRTNRHLYSYGDYQPLALENPDWIVYLRHSDSKQLLVAVPRFPYSRSNNLSLTLAGAENFRPLWPLEGGTQKGRLELAPSLPWVWESE